jgi:hypothetical protein
MGGRHAREEGPVSLSLNRNLDPRTVSWKLNLPEPSEALVDMALRAIWASREGGVHEPFLQHPAFLEAGLQVMGAAGYVSSHRDSPELPPWSYHLVLVNSGYIVRHPEEEAALMPIQPAGRTVRLNIHRRHTLSPDFRSPSWYADGLQEDGDWVSEDYGWASLHFGDVRKLRPREAKLEFLRRAKLLADRAPDLFDGKPLFLGVVRTSDGYRLREQRDGSWTDGDLTFRSFQEMENGLEGDFRFEEEADNEQNDC